jgi:hypothetical protein
VAWSVFIRLGEAPSRRPNRDRSFQVAERRTVVWIIINYPAFNRLSVLDTRGQPECCFGFHSLPTGTA